MEIIPPTPENAEARPIAVPTLVWIHWFSTYDTMIEIVETDRLIRNRAM